MSRSAEFNDAARFARPDSPVQQVREPSPLHPEGKWAYDKYSGNLLSREDAQSAADNPRIYKWAEWR